MKIIDDQWSYEERLHNFATSFVAADVLAPSGAKTYARTMMIKIGVSYIYETGILKVNICPLFANICPVVKIF